MSGPSIEQNRDPKQEKLSCPKLPSRQIEMLTPEQIECELTKVAIKPDKTLKIRSENLKSGAPVIIFAKKAVSESYRAGCAAAPEYVAFPLTQVVEIDPYLRSSTSQRELLSLGFVTTNRFDPDKLGNSCWNSSVNEEASALKKKIDSIVSKMAKEREIPQEHVPYLSIHHEERNKAQYSRWGFSQSSVASGLYYKICAIVPVQETDLSARDIDQYMKEYREAVLKEISSKTSWDRATNIVMDLIGTEYEVEAVRKCPAGAIDSFVYQYMSDEAKLAAFYEEGLAEEELDKNQVKLRIEGRDGSFLVHKTLRVEYMERLQGNSEQEFRSVIAKNPMLEKLCSLREKIFRAYVPETPGHRQSGIERFPVTPISHRKR